MPVNFYGKGSKSTTVNKVATLFQMWFQIQNNLISWLKKKKEREMFHQLDQLGSFIFPFW